MNDLLNKLKKKCSICGKEITFDLQNDDIFSRFTMVCKDCVKWLGEDEVLKCKNKK